MSTDSLMELIEDRIAAIEKRVDRLTDKQKRMLAFIITQHSRTGVFPTVREIAKNVGVASTNTVIYHLRRMEKTGELERPFHRARSYNIPELVRINLSTGGAE